jgi:hypothetical protein
MTFSITIDSQGAHADADPIGLTQGALQDIGKLIEVGMREGPIRDENGNLVGRWQLTT